MCVMPLFTLAVKLCLPLPGLAHLPLFLSVCAFSLVVTLALCPCLDFVHSFNHHLLVRLCVLFLSLQTFPVFPLPACHFFLL